MNTPSQEQQSHKTGSVRHAEKRRIGTCQFADRVAQASVQAFKERVPAQWREENRQVCLAAIVAHFQPGNDESCGCLQVLGLGVGTKYLSGETILAERKSAECGDGDGDGDGDGTTDEHQEPTNYGLKMRDSHAEILARRAFRRKLTLEMQSLVENKTTDVSTYRPILQYNSMNDGGKGKFSLVDGVTIHMYTSSAPCGNSTLKKFAKMKKEHFNPNLGTDEWPQESHHGTINDHSLHLGNFALLVKKDCSLKADHEVDDSHIPMKQKTWPANVNDDWCPPGTSVPHLGHGSIHTCSDKICRWNCLGLQGSLLASLLEKPLYMDSLTVGRKFTRCISQRAVCCRACGYNDSKTVKRKWNVADDQNEENGNVEPSEFQLNHPSIMGTSVYLDDSGKYMD